MISTPHLAEPDHADPVTSPTVVLGVDTHKDVHVAAALDELGMLVAAQSFPATAAGYRMLLAWARSFGQVRQAGVEGTGSFGAALTRYLHGEGVQVVEVHQPDKSLRRRRGKTDAVDAEAAARAVLSAHATAVPKAGDGHVEAMRVFKLARDSAVKSRSQAINQFKAVLINVDPVLRESLEGLGAKTLVRRCAELPEPSPAGSTPAFTAAVYTLRLLARRIQQLTAEAYALEKQLRAAVAAHSPQLLERPGIGPDSAATLLITLGDNPERVRGQASFAALCGVSPVQASSGKTQRLRLNRGGDRQANAALFRIVLTRLRRHQSTHEYLQRRTSEGKTRREIIRCLKYYVAREVYHLVRPRPDSAEPPTATT